MPPSHGRNAEAESPALVAAWFPAARAAWLGGSTATGRATATSDLDVTVLLPASGTPFRDQRRWGEWPVELFVQTDRSLAFYLAADQDRRQPTMARLVGESVVLLDRDGTGEQRRAECIAQIAAGPKPLSQAEIDTLRYAVTASCEDLHDRATPPETAYDDTLAAERAAVATTVWTDGLNLLLGAHRHWTGTGKGLAREVRSLDVREGTSYLQAWVAGLRAALDGDPGPLVAAADAVVDLVGGRLSEGYRLEGRET